MHRELHVCKDCFRVWGEGYPDKDAIKEEVLTKYGESGGEAVDWPKDELERLRRTTVNQDSIINDLYARLVTIAGAFTQPSGDQDETTHTTQ